jgi:hypothetical protein
MPYAVGPSLGMAVVNGSTGQISGDTALTDTGHSYGDLVACGGGLLCVREDGSGDDLVAIDLATSSASLAAALDELTRSTNFR